MSKEFDIIPNTTEQFCNSCTYEDSCRLLNFLNIISVKSNVARYNDRFKCNFFEEQPRTLHKPTGKFS